MANKKDEIDQYGWEEARREVEAEQKNVFRPKIVSWEIIRNIANRLTNQLYLGGAAVNIENAHISCGWNGPDRGYWGEGTFVQGGREGEGWLAFEEDGCKMLKWTSWTSENVLFARKIQKGVWQLSYHPSETQPDHRGVYFALYEHPENVQNITISEESEVI